jgi:hypothetical protein
MSNDVPAITTAGPIYDPTLDARANYMIALQADLDAHAALLAPENKKVNINNWMKIDEQIHDPSKYPNGFMKATAPIPFTGYVTYTGGVRSKG